MLSHFNGYISLHFDSRKVNDNYVKINKIYRADSNMKLLMIGIISNTNKERAFCNSEHPEVHAPVFKVMSKNSGYALCISQVRLILAMLISKVEWFSHLNIYI